MQANIFVIDDIPDNLRLLMGMFREQGYTIRAALDGQHALTSIQAELPDLILLDILMPKMNGYEVCQRLKADERTRDIPIIFISGLHDTVDKVKAFNSGAVDYIIKPFHSKEVLTRIQTHLKLKQLQQELQREIARRQQSEKNLRTLNQQLEAINAEQKTFFSLIAHNLRCPIGSSHKLTDTLVEEIKRYTKDDLLKILRAEWNFAYRISVMLDNLHT